MLNESFNEILRARRSTRDFLPAPIPADVLARVLSDAHCAPSWSNTQPYRIAIASGDVKDALASQLMALLYYHYIMKHC